MKKKYRIKAESIHGDKKIDKVCTTQNISHLVELLGRNGYVVQEYHEVDGDLGDSVLHIECKRRKAS